MSNQRCPNHDLDLSTIELLELDGEEPIVYSKDSMYENTMR